MILNNLRMALTSEPVNIRTANDRIVKIQLSPFEDMPGDLSIDFENAIVFPGLINSHDHLEFNLFPKLGNFVYKNYIEWGGDIFKQNKPAIDAIVKIPKQLRAEWGIIKNLLNGVTTVVQHGDHFDFDSP